MKVSIDGFDEQAAIEWDSLFAIEYVRVRRTRVCRVWILNLHEHGRANRLIIYPTPPYPASVNLIVLNAYVQIE